MKGGFTQLHGLVGRHGGAIGRINQTNLATRGAATSQRTGD
jgi:hypothetical protein